MFATIRTALVISLLCQTAMHNMFLLLMYGRMVEGITPFARQAVESGMIYNKETLFAHWTILFRSILTMKKETT